MDLEALKQLKSMPRTQQQLGLDLRKTAVTLMVTTPSIITVLVVEIITIMAIVVAERLSWQSVSTRIANEAMEGFKIVSASQVRS